MYFVPTLEEIREQILRDYQSINPTIDISVDSDTFARASSLAAVAEGLYAHQKWLIKQFFPDSSDTEYLEKHAGLRGLRRKNATYADGQATVTGLTGAVIAEAMQIKTDDNRFYQTTQAVTIGEPGTAVVNIKSLAMGSQQNINKSTTASFMSAPTGVQSDVVITEVTGGTDAETDASLLARLLELIRRPPAGGNKYDYKNWALEVDGVDAAYVYPLRRGLGTVDIAITSNNTLPSDDTVTRCQNYIDIVRPVTAVESKVVKPDVTQINFDIKVKVEGLTLPAITAAINSGLTAYFDTLRPGDDLIVSQLEAIVSDVVGVVDRRFTTPTANRKADVINKIEWFRLGNVTVSELLNE